MLLLSAGGSIGSALAILIFYPLERVRVELQSGGGGGGDPAVEDEGEAASAEDVSNESIEGDGPIEGDGSSASRSNADPRGEGGSPAGSGSPVSSDGSFEVVSHTDALSSISSAVDCGPSSDSDCDGSSRQAGGIEGHALDGSDATGRRSAASDDERRRAPAGRDAGRAPRRRRETMYDCLFRLRKENSLYRGASPSVTTMMISNGVFFYALQVVKHRLDRMDRSREGRTGRIMPRTSTGRTLLASSVAGAVNVLLTNPLWVSSLRIMESGAVGRQPTVWTVMRDVARDEGPGQLWSGTVSSLMLVSNPIIQHVIYGWFKGLLLEGRGRRTGGPPRPSTALSPLEAFLFGALAKAVATVVTYPLQ